MKNLNLLYTIHKKINNCNSLFLNSNTAGVGFYYSNNCIFGYKDDKEICKIENVIGGEYLVVNDSIFLATESGQVHDVYLDTGNKESFNCSDSGIEKMAWSPNQEIVAFVTKSRHVIVLTSTYEQLSESSLDDDYFGDQEFITAGWGKKETQFHGSEGKQAAKTKTNFVLAENLLDLDQTISITWRGDGEYFAVSFVGCASRMFKVYNKEGELQFTSEKTNNLGTAISWRPSGTWIAVPHVLPNKYTIALFEKNGLRHREIVLPFKYETEKVINLAWSLDSEILAIETLQNNDKSFLYLYTVCNFHWYLKQNLNFDTKIKQFMWDVGINEEKTLHVLLSDDTYIQYRWSFSIYHSKGNTIHNQNIVAVIDGKNVFLTDFRNNIIPPPMHKYNLDGEAYTNVVGFLKSTQNEDNFNQFFIYNAHNKLIFYNPEFECNNLGQLRLKGVKLLGDIQINNDLLTIPLDVNHLLWLNESDLIFCRNIFETTIIYLGKIDFKSGVFNIVHNIEVQGLVGAISETTNKSFVIHLSNGLVFTIDIEDKKLLKPNLMFEIPEFCENIQSIIQNGVLKVVSLRNYQNLYINTLKIDDDVTSFFISEKYLFYTLLSTLKVVLLETDQVIDERKLERGSKLIGIIPKDSRTILQMPRGNLEIIQPRVLSLCIIGDLLDKSEYRKAMEMLRKQRINLNIIVDHNPEKFLSELDDFLEDISNPQWLNLFLTDLQNENVTKTMYSSNYLSNIKDYFLPETKINFICNKMCEHMQMKDSKRFILPIITSFVKKGDLEKALQLIWFVKKNEAAAVTNNTGVIEKSISEEAFRYLLYLVDVNELYNVALGTYDFGLVLFVANKSQKDPKEYIPFLNNLKNLETNYCKYKIDEHLKRYDHALENIAKCEYDHFEECLEFIVKHKLYAKALIQFEGKSEYYKQIALAYADYLRSQGKLENASIMYERSGDFQQAIISAKHVLDWERCLMLTRLMENEATELQKISQALIGPLQENGKFEEAFYLAKTYTDDFSLAVDILLKGRLYLKAIFESRLKNVTLIETIIKPNLISYKDILQSSIEVDKEQYLRFINRLQVVRIERKNKDSNQIYEDVDECDLLSDTSSMNSSRYTGSSRGSGKTFRSSKNRRKHERKLLSLKEGNPFEDIALIDAIYNLIQKILNQQLHIRNTNKALIEICFDSYAKDIQTVYSNLIEIVKESLDEIWIPEMIISELPPGPNFDFSQLQSNQHYAMIKPYQRYKPQLNLIDWEHEILK